MFSLNVTEIAILLLAGSVKDVSPDPLYKLGEDDNLNCRLFTFSDSIEPLVFIESVGESLLCPYVNGTYPVMDRD